MTNEMIMINTVPVKAKGLWPKARTKAMPMTEPGMM